MHKPSLTAAIALSLLTTPALADEQVTITLLGAGDVYAMGGDGVQGGLARLNAVARAERAANPNTLYLFDGDLLSPSLMSSTDQGASAIELTNVVPFDLAVPGNHEFDFGPENFLTMLKASAYPWAAINITGADGKPVEGLAGVTMKEMAGLKIALIPVAQDTTPEVATVGDLVFTPTVEGGIAAAKAAREAGADLVVGVVQTDWRNDRDLISSRAFDVILSGDDHSYGTYYDGITAYVETSIDARLLSPVDLHVTIGTDKDGKRKVSWHPTFRFIDTGTVAPDAETQAKVDAYQAALDTALAEVVGTSTTALDSRRNVVRGQESAMGNLIADAMIWATGADIAIMNGGGIRADKTYDAGVALTRRDIMTELPFGNIDMVTEIPGSQVLAALENAVSQVEKGAGRFAQVAGLTFTYDPTADAGARVSEVMVAGAPLEADKIYKVAVNDYILGGGDGYKALGGGKVIQRADGGVLANDVIAYLQKMGTVAPVVEGRITVLGQ
jgi:2',3'-cyclic-nucleotide 2'-phosphodiesterase (5'-nucleotidase family)